MRIPTQAELPPMTDALLTAEATVDRVLRYVMEEFELKYDEVARFARAHSEELEALLAEGLLTFEVGDKLFEMAQTSGGF